MKTQLHSAWRYGVLLLAASLIWFPCVQAQAPAALVRVDQVKMEPLLQTVPVVGRLVARQAGTVAARVAGPIAEFALEVGDRVETNQVIAVLDAQMLEVNVALARERLAEARARLETQRARVVLARLQRDRLKKLKSTQAASKAQYDDARQSVVIAATEVTGAEAAISVAETMLRQAEIDLDRAEIRAPYAGVITQRLTEAGAYVQTGQDIVRMIGDRALEIEADVPFDRLSGLVSGTEVLIGLDDGTSHVAAVRAVIPQENRLTRTRAVRFVPRFDDGIEHLLAVDQSVSVHVPIGAPRMVLSVHKDAVTRRGGKSLVYVVEDDIAKIRDIRLGEAIGGRFEVLGGLKEGERVVVRGNERLRPDNKVQIEGAQS